MRRIAAIYAIVVGVPMIGQWAMFIATGQAPEFNTELRRWDLSRARQLEATTT